MILAVLVLAVAAVPAAQAQQLVEAPAASAPRSELAQDEDPTPAMQVNVSEAPPVQMVEVRRDAVETSAAAQVSAYNILAIIGAIVVAVALFGLFS